MLCVASDHLVDLFNMIDSADNQLAREIDNSLRFFGLILEKCREHLINRVVRDIPLEQHLEGIFSSFPSWSHLFSVGAFLVAAALSGLRFARPDSLGTLRGLLATGLSPAPPF